MPARLILHVGCYCQLATWGTCQLASEGNCQYSTRITCQFSFGTTCQFAVQGKVEVPVREEDNHLPGGCPPPNPVLAHHHLRRYTDCQPGTWSPNCPVRKAQITPMGTPCISVSYIAMSSCFVFCLAKPKWFVQVCAVNQYYHVLVNIMEIITTLWKPASSPYTTYFSLCAHVSNFNSKLASFVVSNIINDFKTCISASREPSGSSTLPAKGASFTA